MKIKLSKSQWEDAGKKAGWMKTAQEVPSNFPDTNPTNPPLEKATRPTGGGTMITVENHDDVMKFGQIMLETIQELRNRVNVVVEKKLPNARLMPKVWSLLMVIGMISSKDFVDQSIKEKLVRCHKILGPMGLKMKKNFMSSPSKKSIDDLTLALDILEPVATLLVK
jgi:hypothetical protein